MGVETALAIAAVAATASTAYTINETERQKDKVKRDERKASAAAEEQLDERKKRIAGMKTRLFESEGGEVDDDEITTNDFKGA